MIDLDDVIFGTENVKRKIWCRLSEWLKHTLLNELLRTKAFLNFSHANKLSSCTLLFRLLEHAFNYPVTQIAFMELIRI